jgi:hypothetical protein
MPKLPEKYAAKVREIALKTGMSEDEVVLELMKTFLEVVDDPQEADDITITRRLRFAMRKKFGINSD